MYLPLKQTTRAMRQMSIKAVALIQLCIVTAGAGLLGYLVHSGTRDSQNGGPLFIWFFLVLLTLLGGGGALGLGCRMAWYLARHDDLNSPAVRREVIGLVLYVFCAVIGASGMWLWSLAENVR